MGIALQTLRANTVHTFLSTLGLVIGVAALVAILSLGDGLEQYARDQISNTTSLEAVIVQPRTRTWVDGVSIELDTLPDLRLEHALNLREILTDSASLVIVKRVNSIVKVPEDTITTGAYLELTQPEIFTMMRVELAAGTFFEEDDADDLPLVISTSLAKKLAGEATLASMINKTILVGDLEARIIGIAKGDDTSSPMMAGPYTSWQAALQHPYPSGLLARAKRVEDVPAIKARIETWLDENVNTGSDGFTISTSQARVAQAQEGIKLFKIIMGLITGIAVLVGGIGVMNVLLISITERTREIGIRKATGAQKSDVIMQFLTESVAISMAGSLLGLVTGLVSLAVMIPIINNVTEAQFRMGFSWDSFVVVLVVAVVIGVVFGTYPAWRAARLSPVEAIRHE